MISKKDLYELSEQEIINKIEKCDYDNISQCFNIWKNDTEIKESDVPVKNKYCVNVNAKKRYIIPLVKNKNEYVRIDKISEKAKKDINEFLNFKTKPYLYLDLNLKVD